MSQREPVIDGFEFASAGRSLEGVWPVREFARLQDLIAADTGEVAYKVRGVHDERGRPGLQVSVSGVLQLRCQRCLEALAYEVRSDELLLLAATQAEIDAEPADVESADRIVAGSAMAVRELVEDELILALPYAPRHEGCSARASQDAAQKSLPFAGLRGLMRDKH